MNSHEQISNASADSNTFYLGILEEEKKIEVEVNDKGEKQFKEDLKKKKEDHDNRLNIIKTKVGNRKFMFEGRTLSCSPLIVKETVSQFPSSNADCEDDVETHALNVMSNAETKADRIYLFI